MKDEKRGATGQPPQPGSLPNRILGSLRDALNAASRDDRSGEISIGGRTGVSGKAPPEAQKAPALAPAGRTPENPVVAPQATGSTEALRDAKGVTREPRHFEAGDPATQSIRAAAPKAAGPAVAAVDPSEPATVQETPASPEAKPEVPPDSQPPAATESR